MTLFDRFSKKLQHPRLKGRSDTRPAMKAVDILIVVGIVTIPVALFITFGVLAVLAWVYPHQNYGDLSALLGFCIASLVVGLAAGLISSGILMRRRSAD